MCGKACLASSHALSEVPNALVQASHSQLIEVELGLRVDELNKLRGEEEGEEEEEAPEEEREEEEEEQAQEHAGGATTMGGCANTPDALRPVDGARTRSTTLHAKCKASTTGEQTASNRMSTFPPHHQRSGVCVPFRIQALPGNAHASPMQWLAQNQAHGNMAAFLPGAGLAGTSMPAFPPQPSVHEYMYMQQMQQQMHQQMHQQMLQQMQQQMQQQMNVNQMSQMPNAQQVMADHIKKLMNNKDADTGE